MSTFDRFQLKTNPFRLTPAINSEELIWAGFPEVKGKLENRIKRSIQIPNSSLILNWGEYGSGKTHAARYFNKQSVLQEIADGIKQTLPFSLNINFPKSKQPIWDIYYQIIDKLDIDVIREKVAEYYCEDDIINLINKSTDNFYIRNVLKALFNSEVEIKLLKQFLYNRISTGDLKKFPDESIQRTFSSDNDITEFLAAFFSLITCQKEPYSCVIIWFDEFEDISILNSVNINNVNNFLKIIIDKTPNNLLIFLNLTQSAMIDVEDLGEYLQEAVKSRIKDRIELSMPTKEDLKLYLKDLLNNPLYREDATDDYFPFNEDVIDELIETLGNVSLRRFNEAFSLLLESAVFDDRDEITSDYYKKIESEIIGWKD
jgi:hypothetical protein